MNFVKTVYLRVSERYVMPVELHEIVPSDDRNLRRTWLKDAHIKEVLQLMQETIKSFVNTGPGKKQPSTGKQQNKLADIITGKSVRIGYMFKSRHALQTCLVNTSLLHKLGQCEEDEGVRKFSLLKDKLVVYAHEVVAGSTKGSAQLVKLMKEKRQSSGTVGSSISNYFQKLPSQTGSLSSQCSNTATTAQNVSQSSEQKDRNQSTKVAESCSSTVQQHEAMETETDCVLGTELVPGLNDEPASEGKRSRIKTLLDRGAIGKTRRRKPATIDSKADAVSAAPVTATNEKSKTLDAFRYKKNKMPRMDDMNMHSESSKENSPEKCSKDEADDTSMNDAIDELRSSEKCIIGDVTISKVITPSIVLDDNEVDDVAMQNQDTVTLISVEQVKELQKINDNQSNAKRKCENQSVTCDQSHDQSNLSEGHDDILSSAKSSVSLSRTKRTRLKIK